MAESTCRCHINSVNLKGGGGGGGGVQGKFFWRIRFELWAPQVTLIIGETFGEVLGPRRSTVSELRPAKKLGVKYSFLPDGPRGANGAKKRAVSGVRFGAEPKAS